MALDDTKKLGFAVAALCAFGALMVWVLSGTPPGQPASVAGASAAEPAPVPAPVPAHPAAAAAQPQAEQEPQAPAPAPPASGSDLFAGSMPDFMVDAHSRVLNKDWLDVEDQKQLYRFGQEHKDDARPQLILAWDSMNREWYGIAVRMYRIAYTADQRAKDDPSMLRDLLEIASRFDRTEYTEATEVIREAYGVAALPQLDQALADLQSSGDLAAASRLSRLRAKLAGP